METYATTLAIREMNLKVAVRFYFIPVIMVNITETNYTKSGKYIRQEERLFNSVGLANL